MSIVQAEHAACRVAHHAGANIPVDVEAVARAYDLAIYRQDLEEEVSGLLVVKDGRASIGVNSAHHPHRQRFTIAHELGHYFLHRDVARVFIDASTVFFRDERSAEGTRRQEIDANAFAAALLMPEAALREHVGDLLLDELDDLAIRHLAARFEVSVQAMTIRLVRLGLIPA